MKKMLSLLLALCMVLGLAATAFAYPNREEYLYEEDPNDTLWDAQPIELGETYSGEAVAYCGDSDLFTFTLEESSLIRITMESSSDTIDLALFDSAGKLLTNAVHLGLRGEFFNLFTIFPMELEAGTYYVGIWTTDGTNSGYYFEVHQREFMCGGYHQFFTSKPITPATCQSEGVILRTCLCGETKTETVPADPDAHTFATEIVTPATCTENGLARRTCTGCDYQEEETLWAEHTAPGKLVIQEPTMDDYGFYYLTCSDCGFVDIEEERGLYPLDHMFIDVKPAEFYELPVCWAVYKEITSGSDAYHFNPNGQCQRAQVVTFLWRAAGSPAPTTTENPFEDVKESDFYYNAVLWALEKGITTGTDETHFRPNMTCNRATVVTFLYRAMGSPEVSTIECPFTDVVEGEWYEDAVLWAVENGITNGMSADTFGVNTVCNRAQVVTFLHRTYVN